MDNFTTPLFRVEDSAEKTTSDTIASYLRSRLGQTTSSLPFSTSTQQPLRVSNTVTQLPSSVSTAAAETVDVFGMIRGGAVPQIPLNVDFVTKVIQRDVGQPGQTTQVGQPGTQSGTTQEQDAAQPAGSQLANTSGRDRAILVGVGALFLLGAYYAARTA